MRVTVRVMAWTEVRVSLWLGVRFGVRFRLKVRVMVRNRVLG